jgi:beta-xylosidase
MMKYFAIIFYVAMVAACSRSTAPVEEPVGEPGYLSQVWLSDNGDGTYTNPILQADYSDPDVIRVGDDFFMTASSFNSSPGLPILHSKDLVNWQIVNHALPILPNDVYDLPQPSKGVWAPCMRFYNNEYYIYWGDPDFGVFMVKTNDPQGNWEKPVLVKEGKGMIDPSPLWDEDGKAWLVTAWAGSRAGVNSIITIWRMSPNGTELLKWSEHIFRARS